MPDLPKVDLQEIEKIKEIANSGHDRPVFMLNLNRYLPEAGYPNGELYRAYRDARARIVEEVGGKILWLTSVHGHAVGDLEFHETLGVWYPTHQAFLNLSTAPISDENMRLRALSVEEGCILRCDPY